MRTFLGIPAEILIRRVLIAGLISAATVYGGAAAGADKEETTLRFSLREGEILEYKSSRRIEMNWHGIQFARVSNIKSELSLDKQLEEGLQRVALKFTERTDRMQRGSGEFEDFDGPVKPEGKTVRVDIYENGKVKDAIGFIIGVKKGDPLKDYVERWFFRLPDGPVTKGSVWTRTIPEDDTEKAADGEQTPENKGETPEGKQADAESGEETESYMRGTINYELEKFEKKDGIMVAVIKYKAELEARQIMDGAVTESDIKSEGEAKVAVDGGYVVESKLSVEMKGDVINIDDFTGKETREAFVQTLYTEIKLEK
ncbi:MAG: hypothetical protein JW746_00795 [Candidatus Krumholzibacteriota bacterium]|nr:hypothetical protein [Candidatus Krumholzibacteriota bacterium]